MSVPRVSIANVMLLVAVLAVDFAVVDSIGKVPRLVTRIALFGILPMLNILVACLTVMSIKLARHGEVSLSYFTFLLFGGTSVLIILLVAHLASGLFLFCISNTAGLILLPGQSSPIIYQFGLSPIGPIDAFIVICTITPPLLFPSLLAAWTTRGRFLRLVDRRETMGE